MKLAVPTETRPGERRVALVPDVVKKLAGVGWEVCIQAGAGGEAAFSDAAYEDAGADGGTRRREHVLGRQVSSSASTRPARTRCQVCPRASHS